MDKENQKSEKMTIAVTGEKGLSRTAITAGLTIFILYVALHFVGIGCPIKFITGVSCAGCGMTRAWLALLHFDFSSAFFFHPLFFLPPIALIVFFLRKKMNMAIYTSIMLTFAAVFIIIYIIRLADANDQVVVFHPQDGLFFRIYKAICGLFRH